MAQINALLGWAALPIFGLFFVGLFYVDVSARGLLKRLAQGATPDQQLRSDAEAALGKGFRARIDWLESKPQGLQGENLLSAERILRVHSWCWISLVILFALWLAAMGLRD